MKAIVTISSLSLLLQGDLPAFAEATEELPAHNLARELLGARLAEQQRELDRLLPPILEHYDLTVTTRKTIAGLSEDKDFKAFTRDKGMDPGNTNRSQIEPLVDQYIRHSTNISRQITAWFLLTSDARASWQAAHGPFQILNADRPGEFPPRLIMVLRPVSNSSEAAEWTELLRSTYAGVSSPRERLLCLMCVPAHALNLAAMKGEEDNLMALGKWLDTMRSQEGADQFPIRQEIDFAAFFVAFALRDYPHAATLANGPRLRTLRPLMLFLAGQAPAARKAMDERKTDPPLADWEMRELERIADVIH